MSMRCAWRVAILWLVTVLPIQPLFAQPAGAVRVLDHFENLAAWKAAASDGVKASIERVEDIDGAALRLDFDLGGTAGYATASRALPLELPPNYELSFRIRADAPVNDLQIKLADATGDNVWWFHGRNYEFPHEWQRVAIKKRQIEFAWGPATDHDLRRAARNELVVAAGRGGGFGSVYFSDLVLRELPLPPAQWPKPVGAASSSLPGAEAALALDGSVATAWRSDPATGAEQTLTLDLGGEREFGGLIVRWRDQAYASRYDVEFSDDGERWIRVRAVTEGRGGPDALLTADAQTRFVRLVLHDGPQHAYGIAEIEIEDLAFGASPNAFFQALARDSPRGSFPRGFSGEQSGLVARYELANSSGRPLSLRLVLAVRPFQVNPPAQFLNVEGGVSGIRDIAWEDAVLTINGARRVYPLRTPDRVGMAPFDGGPVVKWASGRDWPGARKVHDSFGYASAALDYRVTLAPHERTAVALVVPLSGAVTAPKLDGEAIDAWMTRTRDVTARTWREKLGRVTFDVPEPARP